MLTGVIEGFYGPAWTAAQRLEMMDWIAAAGMTLTVYAPKDDIKIRARWREPYDEAEASALAALAAAAHARGLGFMAAISPCLDIVHSDPDEIRLLAARLDQLVALGADHLALLFDDVPSRLGPADAAAFPSFAAAQVHVANACRDHLADHGFTGRLIVCPTEYCGDFAGRDVPGSAYLATLGAGLHPDIGVFWTGADIVSETIDRASLVEVGRALRRKPFVWDNYHANDYDLRRVHAGPLAGRDRDILDVVDGWITNPNNEFEANFTVVATTGRFLTGPTYEPAAAAAEAIRRWAPRFRRDDAGPERPRGPVPEEQIALIVDLCHQPFAAAAWVEAFLDDLSAELAVPRPDVTAPRWRATVAAARDLYDRVTALYEAMTELSNRDLFYAFHPYLWEARGTLRQIVSYLDWLDGAPPEDAAFPHERFVYNFYRRGFVAALDDIVRRDRAGAFRHGS